MALRVLVVEDDPSIRECCATLLADASYEVQTARNGMEGWQQATTTPFDLILLDLMMPVMDGWTFLEWRRRRAALSAVPVLVVSAGSSADRDRAMQAGATDVLAKPFDVDQLLDRLSTLAAHMVGSA